MRVQEFYDIDVLIDGLSVFNAGGTMFLGASINESLMLGVPTCELKLSVPNNWINQRAIVDGTLIQFKITSKYYAINEILSFRLYDIERLELNQQFTSLQLSGILDFYTGYTNGNLYNYYGNSSDLFNNIANTFNLKAEIDPTNDAQLWTAGENNLYRFMMKVSKHGWIDELSSMICCLDRHKILLYKNLTTLFRSRQDKIYSFIQTPNPNLENKQYGYTSAEINIQSGTENLFNFGYGGENFYFDFNDYAWKTADAKKVVAETNLININRTLSQGLSHRWYPFDVGNYHPNYWKAIEQNSRIQSTYSTYILLKCQFLMNYRLGQIVNFIYMDAQDPNNKVNMASGVAIIEGINISLSTQGVTAGIRLAMQGMNAVATTQKVY